MHLVPKPNYMQYLDVVKDIGRFLLQTTVTVNMTLLSYASTKFV